MASSAMPTKQKHGRMRMEVVHVWEEGIPQTPLPDRWPIARPQLAAYEDRLQRPELRQAFTWYIQLQQKERKLPLLPGCTWCGAPTGMFCDFCEVRPARAVCNDCSDKMDNGIIDVCRICMDDLGRDFNGDPLPF